LSLARAQIGPIDEAPGLEHPSGPEEPATQVATSGGDDHMIAPVNINEKGPFRFIIDTGANTSCVSQDLASRLVLAPGPPKRVHTVVGARERPSVMIDRLQIGDRSRRRITAPAIPLRGIDGILGIDWLKGQRLEMRFRDKSLNITSSRADDATADTVIVPARRRMGQLTIIDADLGDQPISAIIDSGAQTTLCNTPLRNLVVQKERRRGQIETHLKVGLETIAGEAFSGELMYLPFLRLGGLRLGNVQVIHANMHVFALWGLQKTPAMLIGMDLLTQFNMVALDFGRSQVRFDVLQAVDKPAKAGA